MKNLRPLIVSTIVTIGFTILFNTSIGKVPPIGKILDPFNGFWQNAKLKNTGVSGSSIVTHVKQKVDISYDKNRIPCITAMNDRDLYFAQGYVTASERLWQIDFQVRVASGRISEVIGVDALDFDRMQRRKGLSYAATNALECVKGDESFYPLVQAYVDGINAYIATLSYKDFPVEYKLLDYSPAAFTVLDVMYTVVLMVDNMAGTSHAIENSIDYLALGKDTFDFIFPDHLHEIEPIVKLENAPKSNIPKLRAPETIEVPAARIGLNKKGKVDAERHGSGSNSWSVGYSKTQNKRSTYLANDPHLELSLPSIWYVMQLKSPTVNVFGFTIPGTIGVLIGVNDNIAWGVTSGVMNVKGWYQMKFRDSTKKEYLFDGEWLRSQFINEEIKIRGAKSFLDTVVYTHLGPVVYDENFVNPHGYINLAMKWAGHMPGNNLKGLYEINRASCYAEFEKALLMFRAPIINLNFISKENDIAMNIVGALPYKWEGQARFVMPGHLAEYDWSMYVPQDQNPKSINPKNSYVSSANQKLTDNKYPYYYNHYDEHRYRNRRINQLLGENHRIGIKDMMKMQNDNYNQMAKESIDLIRNSIFIGDLDKDQFANYTILMDWDFYNEVDKLAPSIFREWQVQLDNILWKEIYNCEHLPGFYRTVEVLKNPELCKKLNLGKYGSVNNIIKEAFVRAVSILKKWEVDNCKPYTWGNYRVLKIEHLLRIKPFGRYHLNVGGGQHIVNANEGKGGASMRLLVEFDKTPAIWFIYPGGQSGNVGSYYYDNMIVAWEKGDYVQFSLDKFESISNFTLEPINN